VFVLLPVLAILIASVVVIALHGRAAPLHHLPPSGGRLVDRVPSPQNVTPVGAATSFASPHSGEASTTLPAGAIEGDVLVSYVEAYASASIACEAPWIQAFSVPDGGGGRLAACALVVRDNQPRPTVQVRPDAEVSMVTMAFSGVDLGDPILAARAVAGTVSPGVTAADARTLLVLGEGSAPSVSEAQAPRYSRLGASRNDARSSQVAIATEPATSRLALAGAGAWRGIVAKRSVAGTVALRPAAAPGAAPARACEDQQLLTGPSEAPPGAVIVPGGNDRDVDLDRANTTYYFLSGIHTRGAGGRAVIIPGNNSSYIGAPGAVISGQNLIGSAFAGDAFGVTIEYLTVEDFVPANNTGAVNSGSAPSWTVSHDTLERIGTAGGVKSGQGAALMMGSGDDYSDDCLTDNGQYAINGYAAAHRDAIVDGTISHDEISWNGSSEFPDTDCGCSGGLKVLFSTGVILADNYIHDNYNVGAWFDTDNTGALIEGNYIARNWSGGLNYEASTNADITANTFVDNAWGSSSEGQHDFPGSAVYISNSGGNPNDNGGVYATLTVSHNEFVDNWGGVVIFQDPNRYCGNGRSEIGGVCPDVDQSVATPATCVEPDFQATPLFTACQFASDNILVDHNAFNFDEYHIVYNEGPNGTAFGAGTLPGTSDNHETPATCANKQSDCGYNALFSNYGCLYIGCGAFGRLSPYRDWVIPDLIMTPFRGTAPSPGVSGDDLFCDNAYASAGRGWLFQAFAQGGPVLYPQSYPRGIATEGGLGMWRNVWHEDPLSCPGGPG
jgi:hypothetical protein